MDLFQSILNNNSDKTNIKFNFFLSSFSKYSLEHNKINKSNFIKYKFFALKNHIFSNSELADSHSIDIFCKIQKTYMTLLRFFNMIYFKRKQFTNTTLVDLNFNELSTHPDKYKITLIINNIKQQFYIFDLIRIINACLSYDYNFFPEPRYIKNPWDNSKMSLSNIYNIYFFIKNMKNITMPILFYRFFQSNLDLSHYLDHNQFIIKDYIIKNYKNFTDDQTIKYIKKMIHSYNRSKGPSNNIVIDYLFPDKKSPTYI